MCSTWRSRLLKLGFPFIYISGKTIHGEINANLMPFLYIVPPLLHIMSFAHGGKKAFS